MSSVRDEVESDESPHPAHYQDNVLQITALGDRLDVVASEDIYSDTGAKLLAKGASINSGRQVLLLKQKLTKPLDTVIAVNNGVDAGVLHARAEQLLSLPVREGGLKGLRWSEPALLALDRFPLCSVVANKLTLAQSDWPNLFDHGIRAALLCASLAHQIKMLPERETLLAGAGLLHDLGMLHLDPALANKKDYQQALNTDQLMRIKAHTVLGGLIAGLGGYPEDLKIWIEQHHERIDGSGYPEGIKANNFCLESQLLALSEILLGLLERGRVERWSVTIKNLASEHFNAPLCIAALDVGQAFLASSDEKESYDKEQLATDLRLLQSLSAQGEQLLGAHSDSLRQLHELLSDFKHTGISSPMVPELLQAEGEDELVAEAQALMGEYIYRMRVLLQEYEVSGSTPEMLDGWKQQVRQLAQRYL